MAVPGVQRPSKMILLLPFGSVIRNKSLSPSLTSSKTGFSAGLFLK